MAIFLGGGGGGVSPCNPVQNPAVIHKLTDWLPKDDVAYFVTWSSISASKLCSSKEPQKLPSSQNCKQESAFISYTQVTAPSVTPSWARYSSHPVSVSTVVFAVFTP